MASDRNRSTAPSASVSQSCAPFSVAPPPCMATASAPASAHRASAVS